MFTETDPAFSRLSPVLEAGNGVTKTWSGVEREMGHHCIKLSLQTKHIKVLQSFIGFWHIVGVC